ncbi:MAG: hypothetical protein HOC72_11630, partial [Rhodospirillaceae bacterium]|nr:hypothetical protein [Rhodospirillaceae bacterium]
TIQSGEEIYAYVINKSKNGDHYWVYAHVTPWFDETGKVSGYHSSRRGPNREPLNATIIPLYKQLLAEEAKHGGPKEGLAASCALLAETLDAQGFEGYEEFIHRAA